MTLTPPRLRRPRTRPPMWPPLWPALWLTLGLAGAGLPAQADDRPARVPLNPAYQQECGACHIAYPPGLLPAPSWQRLMANLPSHFGTDASLDPQTLKALSTWLAANAAQGRRASATPPPEDRITRSSWFLREHDEIAPATWRRASIKSASNCAACHTRADQGDFDEHAVRIPR
jgi:Dihaem cytochrome c